jgi:hypothetical protein
MQTFFTVLFIAPVTPLLQCEPNPVAVTKRIAISFIFSGIAELRSLPSRSPVDASLHATTSPTFFSDKASRCPSLSVDSPREGSQEDRTAITPPYRKAKDDLIKTRNVPAPKTGAPTIHFSTAERVPEKSHCVSAFVAQTGLFPGLFISCCVAYPVGKVVLHWRETVRFV